MITKTTRIFKPKTLSDLKEAGGISMLYGRDLKEYENLPIEEILNKLTEEELEQLSNEVDPDDSHIPPHLRCRDQTRKSSTGPLDRKKLLDFLTKYAKEQEDWPENKPFQTGVKRGKVWVPKEIKSENNDEDKILLDLDDDAALKDASEADLVDLAGILGLHSMLNQDQYHASIVNKGQNLGTKFESIVKATQPKKVPFLPDNDTDVEKTSRQIAENDASVEELNWNNIKHIPRDTFKKLFEGLKKNTKLRKLSLTNTGLTDGPAEKLVEAIKQNKSITTLNLESNFLSGAMIRDLIAALNENQTVVEFRAANQRPQILGNRIEMEIAKLVEQNKKLKNLGLNFDVPDARLRVTQRLQSNSDDSEYLYTDSRVFNIQHAHVSQNFLTLFIIH
ncbi:Tropomodulin-like protein [Leptotrombidium deliense]|uniref:Tropomodulin-like protein n=1 Tax=Leptotrombidium deliense TaxID=299467 RepID=A0A443SP75_9ACAR|nr:Tropomodulin-like protein [Leptotrombidium deliense]